MRYAILFSDSSEGLVAKVRDTLDDGWKPIGGVAVRVIAQGKNTTTTFYQSMVRT